MNAAIAIDWIAVSLIGLAMLLAMVLASRFAQRHRPWLVAMQPLAAGLLLAALLLRDAPGPSALLVLTPNADMAALGAEWKSLPGVALPGAPTTSGALLVPDLATALRQHPGVLRLQVLGDGLAAHDRAAAAGIDLDFTASARVEGEARLVELTTPRQVRAGASWSVSGRLRGKASSVSLFDPAAQAVDEVVPDNDGRFVLHGLSRAPGPALFELRLNGGERVLQSLALPIDARTPVPIRALLLAATPSPDVKYLRRWALDAGVELDSRVALAPGLAQRRGEVTLDADSFERIDLLVADERSWRLLAPHLPALRTAIADGMGLMLRVTGPIPDAVARDWKTLGVELVSAAARPIEVQLGPASADAEQASAPVAELHAWPLSMRGDDQVALLRARDGTVLASWRSAGQGRIGVWWLTDSHRLVTRGEREMHATLWSDAWTTLARADAKPAPRLPALSVVGSRAVVCAQGDALRVEPPSGAPVVLARDAASGDCAAYWPSMSGWHRLSTNAPAIPVPTGPRAAVEGEADTIERSHHFYVHAADEVSTLIYEATRAATARLANSAEISFNAEPDRNPWRAVLLLAWLLTMGLIWWIERRARRSNVAPVAAAKKSTLSR